MTDVVALDKRYFITSRSNWHTVDGDGFGAIVKDRATGRCFTVLAEPEMQNLVCEAMNLADETRERLGESHG